MTKTFHHDLVTLPPLQDSTASNGSRVYLTPDGKKYPSVTTVLAELKKQKILEWRARVGNEEANRISGRASRRGNTIHTLCEQYINNQPFKSVPSPIDLQSFQDIQRILDDKVDCIRAQETGLYSDYLKSAGRVDLIANYEGRLSIIDFKTSTKPKKKEWIDNYFMQASAYAVMFEERTGIPVSRCVIIIAVDHHEPQVFLEKRDDWIYEYVKARLSYKERYNV